MVTKQNKQPQDPNVSRVAVEFGNQLRRKFAFLHSENGPLWINYSISGVFAGSRVWIGWQTVWIWRATAQTSWTVKELLFVSGLLSCGITDWSENVIQYAVIVSISVNVFDFYLKVAILLRNQFKINETRNFSHAARMLKTSLGVETG